MFPVRYGLNLYVLFRRNHELQEAWRQDELIGGKPPSRKVTLTLTFTQSLKGQF
jgi:hypothetical protein